MNKQLEIEAKVILKKVQIEIEDDQQLQNLPQIMVQQNFVQLISNLQGLKKKQKVKLIDATKQSEIIQSHLKKNKVPNPLENIFANPPQQKVNQLNILFCQNIETKQKGSQIPQLVNNLSVKITKQIIQKSVNVQDFFINLKKFVLDLFKRKSNLNELLGIIRNQPKSQNLKILSTLTLKDLVVTIIRSIPILYREQLGIFLTGIRYPIPVLYRLKQQTIIDLAILSSVLKQDDRCLITSFGTVNTQKKGKSALISNVFFIKPECVISDQKSLFHKNSIDFYVSTQLSGSKNMIADCQSNILLKCDKYQNFLKSLIKLSKMLIVHVSVNDFYEGKSFSMEKWKNEYLDYIKDSNVVFIFRDVDSVPQKSRNQQVTKQLKAQFKQKCIILNVINLSKVESHQDKKILIEVLRQNLHGMISKSKSTEAPSIYKIKQYFCQTKINNQILNCFKKLKEDQFFKNNFPFLTIIINECQLKIKQKNIEQSYYRDYNLYKQKWKIYEKQKEQFQQRKKNIKLSEFVLLFKKILQSQNQDEIIYFQFEIIKWKKPIIDPIEKKLSQLNFKIQESKLNKEKQIKFKNETEQLENKKQYYDISLDTLIQELIVQHQTRSLKQSYSFIKNYFVKSHLKVIPINFIEGKTLKFGSNLLRDFIVKISNDYKNKKIYIVSVIGAQSSAKSTLLNYLFGCNFVTSAGRCTKGAYFTIVQYQDFVIIVIDSEGLLSISARDGIFDVQIATMMFSISNVVIINNKGEINTTLRDLLGVCLFAMSCLDFTSKPKLLFVLRDQTDFTQIKQEQMLGNLIRTLNQEAQKSNLTYSKYLEIGSKDIFLFPNAFNQQLQKGYQLVSTNNLFGSYIFALRSYILNYLQNQTKSKFTNIQHFYISAQTNWKTIIDCGSQMMNFKSLHQVRLKQELQKICDKVIKQNQQLFKQLNDKFNKIKQSKNLKKQNLNDYLGQLQSKGASIQKELLQKFDKLCEMIQANQQFKKPSHQNIKSVCNRQLRIVKKDLMLEANTIQQNEQQQKITQQIDIIISKLISENADTNNSQIYLKQFNVARVQKQKFLLKEYEKLTHQKNDIQIGVKKVFQKIIKTKKSQIKNSQLNISQNKDLLERFIKGKSTTLLQQWCQMSWLTTDKDDKKTKLISYLQSQINQYKKSIQKFQCKNVKGLQSFNFKLWEQQVTVRILAIKKHIQDMKSLALFKTIQFRQSNCEKVFICYMIDHLTKIIHQNQQKQKLEYKNKIKQSFDSKKQKLSTLIGSLGDAEKTAISLYQQIQQHQFQKESKAVQSKIIDKIREITNRLRFNTILKTAFNNSIHLPTKDKQKWIACWKVIRNPQKFIKQILYNQNQLKSRQIVINQQLKNSQQKIKKQLQLIYKLLQNYNKQQKKNYGEFIKKYNLTYIHSKNIQIQTLFRKLQVYLKQHLQSKIMQKAGSTLKKKVDTYIQSVLVNDVIGCRNKCPYCRAKCEKQYNHTGGHHINKQNHMLAAFNGIHYVNTYLPSLKVCLQTDNLKHWCDGKGGTMNLYQKTKKDYPDWKDSFPQPDQHSQHCNPSSIQNQKQIWANIREMLIKYHLKHIVDGKMQQFQSFILPSRLNDNDMETVYNIGNQSFKLKDY